MYASVIPTIENIHQKILELANRDGGLDMTTWHVCDTTHCRAGWAVFIAGEDGKKLEERLGTPLAAAIIYDASSPIKIHWALDFYKTNDEAMVDMKRCAEEEKSLVAS